jgi:hypothetical protein
LGLSLLLFDCTTLFDERGVKWNLEFSISRERIIDSISLPQIHKENGLVTIGKSVVILVPQDVEESPHLEEKKEGHRNQQDHFHPSHHSM